MAYQNLPRFNPNYGNRYGFRQKPAPSTAAADQPVPGTPAAPPPAQEAPPAPTASSTKQRIEDYSGTSAEDMGHSNPADSGGANAAGVRGAASQGLGYQYGRATPAQMLSGVAGVFGPPGLQSLVDYGAEKTGWGSGGIPAHEQYGAQGTADIVSGGVFGADGRAYDPITGRGLNSYGSKDAFKSGSYMQGIMDNPWSPQSYLSDPDNAFDYKEYNPGGADKTGLQAQGFQFAKEQGLASQSDDTGPAISDAELAKHIGQTEYGFEEHTVEEGSATNEAIQGLNYSDSGAAGKGSQFSSTGTFSSTHTTPAAPTPAPQPVQQDTSNDDNFNDTHGTSSGGAAHSGGYGGYADDAGASDSGGGGGGK